MHKEFLELESIFGGSLQETSIPFESGSSLKDNANKGYSFPRYLVKYNGFLPDTDSDSDQSKGKISGEDVRRIFRLDSEYIHNYFMEYQKNHFSPLRLCNNKVIERICHYFESDFTPSEKTSSSCTSSSNDKENPRNTISGSSNEGVSSGEELLVPERKEFPGVSCMNGKLTWEIKNCHLKLEENEKSLFLRKAETSSYSHVDPKFRINLEDVSGDKDVRTTCMIKNIPNKYTQKMLIELLNEHHFGCYDFVYLRMDFKNKCNVGYAFVNMIDPLCIVSFYKKINHKGWKKFSSNKIAQLTYASIQGLENLKKKFRKSSVMQEQESYRPKLFYSEGPLKGYEKTEF